MKTLFKSFAAGLALVLTAAIARADFETWKNKDGKAAELEITGVDEGSSGAQVHFRTKAGKDVIFKIENLAAEDQARALDWKSRRTLVASFGYATNEPLPIAEVEPALDPAKPPLLFIFDLKGEIALSLSRLKISNGKIMADGKELIVGKWTGIVDDTNFRCDPVNTPPPGPPARKWSLVIKAEGDFGSVDPSTCEFSADVEVSCGKSPKEVRMTMPLPKGENFNDDDSLQRGEQTVDPFTIRMSSAFWPLPGQKDNNTGKVTGYSFIVVTNPEKLDVGFGTEGPVISRSFVVKGKEYPWSIYKSDATDPVDIVVKYWSEAYTVPLQLSKAASNKGRTPPAEGATEGEGKAGE
jgi:hypothetical protein